jgi:hypothetical protein
MTATITHSYLCPTCLDHPVEVTTEGGFAATQATVTGCEGFGELVSSIVIPVSQIATLIPWSEVTDRQCGDLPRWCSPCRKALGLRV